MPPYRKDELPEGRTDWEMLARPAGGDDPENPPWTRDAFAEADLVTPGGLARTPVYIRMYSVVLEYYRSFGKGYQTRINDDLLELVRKRRSRENRIDPVVQRRVRIVGGSAWSEEPGAKRGTR